MMAGEIGASVVVVKEIEVPPGIAALADRESGYTDPDTGAWTRKMRRRGPPAVDGGLGALSTSATSATETETDLSAAELTDADDAASSLSSAVHTPALATPPATLAIAHRPIRTHPARPTAQSSPFIAPLDDDLALFSMEPEHEFRDDPSDDELGGAGPLPLPPPGRASFAGLEIAAVYKPRPVRQRPLLPGGALGPTPGRHGKRYNKAKEKRVHPWQQQEGGKEGLSKEEKAALRREARDRKREEKRTALVALAQAEVRGKGAGGLEGVGAMADGESVDGVDVGANAQAASGLIGEVEEEANALAEGVEGLHAAVEGEMAVAAGGLEAPGESGEGVREARLIVEALVVRKLSIEEATLDFSRLALA